MLGKNPPPEEPSENQKQVLVFSYILQTPPAHSCTPPGLTQGASDWTCWGRVDLSPVILDALGQFDEGGVSGEGALGPGRGEQIFGAVIH